MKKLLALLLSLALLLMLLAGCDLDLTDTLTTWAKDVSSMLDEELGDSEASEKLTVHEVPTVDQSGNAISVPSDARRIISLEPGVTDALIRLGLGSRISGVDSDSSAMSGLPSALNVYDTAAIGDSIDELLQSSPDILFVDEDTYSLLGIAPEVLESDEEAADDEGNGTEVVVSALTPLERLKAAGVCVACVPEPKTLAEIMDMTLFVGYCFEMYDESETLVYKIIDAMSAIEETAKEVTDTRTVYVETDPYVSVGFGEILNELIDICGAKNVFLSRDNVIRVTTEEVVDANPEIIITCVGDLTLEEGQTIHTVGEERMSEIASREGWEGISAVVSGTLYYLESSLVPGPGIVDAMNEVASMCYPRLFS